MGRWSAQHRKTAIFGWFAFVIVAFALGIMKARRRSTQATSGVGESGQADRILDDGFKQPADRERPHPERDAHDGRSRRSRPRSTDVVAKVTAIDVVQNVRSPLDAENAGQVSADGRSVLVDFQIRGDSDDALTRSTRSSRPRRAAQKAHPDLFIGAFGVSAEKEVEAAFMDDLKKAGLLSIPVTLIILIIVFGALVAAGIPLLLALTAIFATFGLIALPSAIFPIDEVAYEVILLIGLAVGVDYSMFYLKREREERAAGRSEDAALQAAAETSGRSVLVSGLTVIVAMAGMFFAGVQGMTQFGVGTILVVACAMLGSLTVLPATLSVLGDKVDRGRVPFVSRLRRDDGEGRIWGAIVDRVLRRPVISVVAAAGLLLLLALPAIQLRPVQGGIESVPAVAAEHPGLQQDPGRVPGERDPRQRRHQDEGLRHDRDGVRPGPAPPERARERPAVRADHGRRERGGDRRERRDLDRRRRDRRRLGGRARDAARSDHPGDGRRGAGHRGRRHRASRRSRRTSTTA